MTFYIEHYISSLILLFCVAIMVDLKRVHNDNRRQMPPGGVPPGGVLPDGVPPGGVPPGGVPPGDMPPGGLPPGDRPPDHTGMSTPPAKGGGGQAEKDRFTTPTTTQKRFARTTPFRVTFEESCDYLAHYCLKAYNTGKLCGRTLYYTYHTFKNYCLLDYVNCMERYEVWQVVHMGECFNITELTEYLLYPYDDDYFLDQYYVIEDH